MPPLSLIACANPGASETGKLLKDSDWTPESPLTEDDDEEASEDIPSSEPLNIPVPIAAKTTIKTTINATKPTIIIFLLFSSSPADAGT